MVRLLLLLVLWIFTFVAQADDNFATRPDVQSYIQELVQKYHFKQTDVEGLFNNLTLRPELIDAMKKPYEAQPWYIYREHFLTPQRIAGGVAFWHAHEKVLTKISNDYNVPVSVIVAIIGVETHYGTNRGTYPVLNTLATLGFDYPPRQDFFRNELTQFLLLAREQGWDAKKVLGSYAGAVGQPQFMPSSYRAYAVDYDKTGKIDLFDNIDDIIASVANYLSSYGWQMDQPTVSTATLVGDDYKTLPNQSTKPQLTLNELAHYGITTTNTSVNPTTKAIFFNVQINAQGDQQYWLGFHNFYVITRYNTSALYALAVTQLAQAIEQAYNQPSGK